jgi:anti-sigma regulatory factor (Ser/Thr protein kinase)
LRELALHLLDIAENSISADAKNIRLLVKEDLQKDQLLLVVEDDGKGIEPEMLKSITDPFTTSRTTRKVGLGIPLLKAAAEACDGYFNINSAIGKGTHIETLFKRSHIDRMPLGNLAETFLALSVCSPEINWTFLYQVGEKEFKFDHQFIRNELQGIPFSDPSVLAYIREELQDGISSIQPAQ